MISEIILLWEEFELTERTRLRSVDLVTNSFTLWLERRICLVCWRCFLAFIEATALVAKWFRRIFEPPVQSRCSRNPTNNTKVTSKE